MTWLLTVPDVQAAGFQLGIDFGTSHTVAVLRWPDGRARPLLFDGSPLLPSAVYVDAEGRTAVGRDALDSARLHPSGLEPNPKRRVDDGSVLLGEREVPVAHLIGAVLRRVADESERTAGERPAAVTLTCPAAWGTPRQRVLLAGAALAGLRDVRLVEEPVAAATYFAEALGHRMPVGSAVVVYDFGAGTFDASLVERTGGGFRTLAVGGRDDIGGLDLDEVIVRRIGEVYGPLDPASWRRLAEPANRQDRRQRRLFRDDVRGAKERLSRHPTAEIHVPGVDRDAHVTREEFEHLARPLLDGTVRVTAWVAGHDGFPRERIAGVFLVGGTSRIPLIATLVHHGLGIPPTVMEQPELVVAEGSILVRGDVALARGSARAEAAPPPPHGPAPAAVPPTKMTPPIEAPQIEVAAPRIQAAPIQAAPIQPASAPTGRLVGTARPVSPMAGGSPAGYTTSPPRPMDGPGVSEPRPGRRLPRRWLAAGIAVAVLVAGVAVWQLWPKGETPPDDDAIPAACGLVARAKGTEPLPPGPLGPDSTTAHDGWVEYSDPSGFRIDHPVGWVEFRGNTVCFGQPQESRYLAVDQWRQSETDMKEYWRRKESQVSGRLKNYELIAIRDKLDYRPGAAEWEFTFDDGDVKMHVAAIALVGSGDRGYAYLWATRESIWQTNLPEYAILLAAFVPARR